MSMNAAYVFASHAGTTGLEGLTYSELAREGGKAISEVRPIEPMGTRGCQTTERL